MLLSSLLIKKGNGDVIRNIPFHQGLNLIMDSSSPEETNVGGNGVGKTTVLKVVSFCLGGDGKKIYTDETTGKKNKAVFNFLVENDVSFILTITSDDFSNENKHTIERLFCAKKKNSIFNRWSKQNRP